ncbi:MAG: hypothetical protein ABH851_01615, partial [Methanobacteriota archaeon]
MALISRDRTTASRKQDFPGESVEDNANLKLMRQCLENGHLILVTYREEDESGRLALAGSEGYVTGISGIDSAAQKGGNAKISFTLMGPGKNETEKTIPLSMIHAVQDVGCEPINKYRERVSN